MARCLPGPEPFPRIPFTRLEGVLAGALMLAILLIQVQGISGYFLHGHQGFNGALRSTIARNYVRHGFVETGFLPMKNQGERRSGEPWVVHWHHPPLINMMVAVSFHLFGERESSARLVPIFFTLLSVLLLYALVRRRYGPGAALLTGLIFGLSPMVIEYGSMPNYEAPIIAFALAALWFLDRLRYDGGGKWSLIGLIAALLAAGFTDWPGFILAGFIGLDALARPPRKPLVFGVTALLTAALLAGLWLWLNAWAEHDGLAGLARYRAGMGSIKVTYPVLYERTLARVQLYFGVVAALPALLWTLWELTRRFRMDPVVFTFFFGTVLYFLAFRAGAYIHSFFLHYLSPAVAVAAGVGLFAGARRLWALISGRWPGGLPLPGRRRLGLRWLALPAVLLVLVAARYQVQIIGEARGVSYGLRGDVRRGAPFPRRARLDAVLLAKLMRSMTRPGDLVQIHPRSLSSPQFRYYLDRKTIRSAATSRHGMAALYLVPERLVRGALARQLLEGHQVIRTMGYLIVNLRRPGPATSQLDFVTYPASPGWAYLHSHLYPPHRLIPRKGASRGDQHK